MVSRFNTSHLELKMSNFFDCSKKYDQNLKCSMLKLIYKKIKKK
jgi:hypothetical protein